MPTVSFTVQGRVQGVGFRYFVYDLAMRLGVEGEVWNAHGGTVRGLAHHEDAQTLDRFCSSLSQGPGRVTRVLQAESFEERDFSSFKITHGE